MNLRKRNKDANIFYNQLSEIKNDWEERQTRRNAIFSNEICHYNLLLENHPECDITYNLYKELIACNLSYDIINQILCDNVNLGIIDGKPTIKSIMGDYVLGSDFSFKQVLAPSKCADTLCKAEGSCTLDSAGFLKRLMSDYGLTKAQKADILSKVQK